ncbi:MAG: hypothetical protein JOZ57_10840, partial [Abitibacteriaceae bacterium]|nr:hypothetical protein [Abditibacteriaceae bacterium]
MGIRVQSWLSFLPALVGLLLCLMSCTGTASANVHWINAAGGNWSDPNNWQDDNGQHRLPTNDAADITLSGAYTVTLDVDDTCQLLLGDGSGGQTLTIPAGRTLTVKSRFSANGATVNNAGTMVFDVVDFQGYLVLDNGATLNNLTGGLLDFRSSRNMEWQGNGAQPKLVNAGGATLRVDDPIPGGAGGAGNLDILTVLLDNSGTLDVEGTSMRLVLGGDSRFTGQLRDGTVITGPSTCIWAGGNLTATGTITINADCHMTGGCVFGGTHTLTGSGALQCQDDSNLSGAGITTTARGFHVYFTHDPVTLTSQTARTVTPRVASSTVNLNGHTINNSGVVTIVSGERLLADNGAVINNLAGGVFGAQGGGLLTWDGHGRNPQLNNQAGGILRQVANVNTGAVSFTLEDIVFTNSGQIDAQGTDTSNNILVLDNVNHGGGRVALNDGTLVTGPGACRLDTSYDTASSLTRTATGTITINGTLRSDTYGSAVGSYGTLAGTFTMEGTGVFQWGGYLIGPGKTTFAPGFHVQTIGGTLAGHTVVNKGTVTPIRNLFLAGTALFNNASGGLLDFASDDPNGDDLDGRNGSAAAPPVLHNLAGGVIRKSGGTNFNTIQDLTTINSGTIEARSGNLWLCGGIYNGSRGSFTQ